MSLETLLFAISWGTAFAQNDYAIVETQDDYDPNNWDKQRHVVIYNRCDFIQMKWIGIAAELEGRGDEIEVFNWPVYFGTTRQGTYDAKWGRDLWYPDPAIRETNWLAAYVPWLNGCHYKLGCGSFRHEGTTIIFKKDQQHCCTLTSVDSFACVFWPLSKRRCKCTIHTKCTHHTTSGQCGVSNTRDCVCGGRLLSGDTEIGFS